MTTTYRCHTVLVVDDMQDWQPEYDCAVAQSISVVCPICGDTWAKFYTYYVDKWDGVEHKPQLARFTPKTAVCEVCGNGTIFIQDVAHIPIDRPWQYAKLSERSMKRDARLALMKENVDGTAQTTI